MPDPQGARWLVEDGIGEQRAIRIEHGQVTAARLHWPGALAPGQVADAVLTSRSAGARRGLVTFAGGEQALVDGLARETSQGAVIRVVVTRAALAETGRFKLAQVRPTSAVSRPAPTLAERLAQDGHEVALVRRFPEDEWPELVAEARHGVIAFPGGTLVVTPTPAMTLIDIDGTLSLAALARAAVAPIAATIRRFDIGGSIGIDFPSLEQRQDRRAVDTLLAQALADWPHEATGMNGFGFVQLVARLEHASIPARLRSDPAGAAARLLLRQAELIDQPGSLVLTCPQAVRDRVTADWEAQLVRRTGRRIAWRIDPGLALAGGFAQATAP